MPENAIGKGKQSPKERLGARKYDWNEKTVSKAEN